MKTIKIGFKNFSKAFNYNDNIFVDILRKKYEVIICDNPDYMFYSVQPSIESTPTNYSRFKFIKDKFPNLYTRLRRLYSKNQKKEIEVPEGNFIKIFVDTEYVKPDMNTCDWAISQYPEEEIKSDRYFRVPLYMITDWQFNKNHRLPHKEPYTEKTEFCNFIYFQDVPARNKFFKELSKYKKIDAPGRSMNNMKSIDSENSEKSRQKINWLQPKLEFIKKYKFTIAYENMIADGWTTEKLTHPLMVGSIPIYVGNKQIAKDFNTKSFINYNNFKNIKELVEYIDIIDNDEEMYNEIIQQPIFKNKEQEYFHSDKRMEEILDKIVGDKNGN